MISQKENLSQQGMSIAPGQNRIKRSAGWTFMQQNLPYSPKNGRPLGHYMREVLGLVYDLNQAVEEDHFTLAEPSPKSWSMLAISSGDGLIRYWSLNARSRCSRS